VKVFADPNRPGFAIDLQVAAAFPHQMAAQIGPIDVEFLQGDWLPIQIPADGFRHPRFGHIRRCDSHCSDETCIQVVEHMSLVSIYPHAPTFASVAHLPILDADAPIFGDALDEAGFALLIDLYILLLDLLCNL